jgi:hypothetical protein
LRGIFPRYSRYPQAHRHHLPPDLSCNLVIPDSQLDIAGYAAVLREVSR